MKKIIFDTDIGGDCDDMGALAIVHSCFEQAENMAGFFGNGVDLEQGYLDRTVYRLSSGGLRNAYDPSVDHKGRKPLNL